MKIKCIALAVCTFTFTGLAFAQAKADPKVTECRAKLNPLQADVVSIIAKGKAAGNISKSEAAEFTRIEAVTKRAFDTAKKDGLTLAECETTLKELNNEKGLATKMAADKTEVFQCSAKIVAAKGEITTIIAKGKEAGNVSETEQREIASLEKAVDTVIAKKSKDGLTPAECQAIMAELDSQKAKAIKMTADKGEATRQVAMCNDHVAGVYERLLPTIKTARDMEIANESEQAEFKKAEEAQAKSLADSKKATDKLADCEARLKAAHAGVDSIKKIVARLEPIGKCIDFVKAKCTNNLRQIAAGRKNNKVTPAEDIELKKIEDKTNKFLMSGWKKAGYTMAECQTQSADLAKDAELIFKLAR